MAENQRSRPVNHPCQVTRMLMTDPQPGGMGAVVRRSIGRYDLSYYNPFLLLDEFSITAPAFYPGFEALTYMLQVTAFVSSFSNRNEVELLVRQGSIKHEDFKGHEGTIATGDVQWMTAGRGIVHAEMPAEEGAHKGLQLMINLSSKYKMEEPEYKEVSKEDVPEIKRDGVSVKIVSGEAFGVKSKIYTRTPIIYLDFTLKPGARLRHPISKLLNSFVYVLEGEARFGNRRSSPVSAHQLILLGAGDGVKVWNKSSKPARFILIGGEPINEPVVQYGPFVMNTQEEIDQTIADFENCTNGFENAMNWKSKSAIDLGL